MLILFDHGTPRGLALALTESTVTEAKAKDWEQLSNGDDLLLTTDQRIRYQQDLTGRKTAIVVLSGSTKSSRVRLHCGRIAAAVDAATPGSYIEVEFPFTL